MPTDAIAADLRNCWYIHPARLRLSRASELHYPPAVLSHSSAAGATSIRALFFEISGTSSRSTDSN